MSCIYCEYCHRIIDTDIEDQHFDEELEYCEKEKEFNSK